MVESPTTQLASSRPSFEDFVAARGAVLLRTAWLLTGDHQRAEDLVQTALGKTWPHWSRIGEGGGWSHEAYVRKVMLTTYTAWWRRRWNGEYPTDELPEPRVGVGGAEAEDTAESAVALRQDVLKALAQLPRGQRAIVVLRYYEDLTEQQTAATLGCSVGTVKSQCSRALAALRRNPALLVGEDRHG